MHKKIILVLGGAESQDPVITASLVVMVYKKDNRTATFNMKDQLPTTMVAIQIAP